MGYYVVPLSTMVTIVRTRNAASIYPPLAVAVVANGSLWTVYGFGIGVRLHRGVIAARQMGPRSFGSEAEAGTGE
jgi:hypothetical protein